MNEIKSNIAEYQLNVFPLDNFAPFGLTMDNEYFQTSEHAFQYLKFIETNPAIANKIKEAYSPNEAREIASNLKEYRDPNWSKKKYKCMEKVLRLKVEQNEIVQNVLLSTNNYLIAECCIDEDTDWGLDNNNKGKNNLGKIWMKIREETKNK
jgi:ribA/ribD-fused uncharacterized protein